VTTPKKLLVGVRTVEKMFRVTSMGGLIVDAVLAMRDKPPLDANYFTGIQRAESGTSTRLFHEERGHELIVDLENVIFIHNCYKNDKDTDFDVFLSAFAVIWPAVQGILKVKDIRRIGLVAEYRFPLQHSSTKLLSALTRFNTQGIYDKFNLQYETRRGTGMGGLPDPTKDDFFNAIRHIYDSAMDRDLPQEGHYNANLDVQRYYAPAFNGNVVDEAKKLRGELGKQLPLLLAELQRLGLHHAEAA
jgi:hypothetical protein